MAIYGQKSSKMCCVIPMKHLILFTSTNSLFYLANGKIESEIRNSFINPLFSDLCVLCYQYDIINICQGKSNFSQEYFILSTTLSHNA